MQTTAHFTRIHETILAELGNAQQSIYIAVAWFTDREIFQALCTLAGKGVSVNLLISSDKTNFREDGLKFDELKQRGGNVDVTGGEKKNFMHNKFCVIDEQTVITGSFNWSYKARQNHENITISTDAEPLAGQFMAEFRQLRDRYAPAPDKAPLNLGNVLKRLDIIKTLIALDEPDELTAHLDKLAQQHLTDDLEEIVVLLRRGQFAEAVGRIEQFGKQHTTLAAYVDVELSALRIEIRILELQVQALEAEKADMEKLLHEFRVQHTLHLGDLILQLLELRKTQATTDEERTEAETDYKAYNRQHTETRQPVSNPALSCRQMSRWNSNAGFGKRLNSAILT